jgi:hypothetical protein
MTSYLRNKDRLSSVFEEAIVQNPAYFTLSISSTWCKQKTHVPYVSIKLFVTDQEQQDWIRQGHLFGLRVSSSATAKYQGTLHQP